ncbi:MAG: hypothetical protein Q7T21_07795 [Gallionella sp.]|nr:hypothetical protein [Gallionella sp.]
MQHIADMQREIFGPVLHIVRWSGDRLAVIEQINALGTGLTATRSPSGGPAPVGAKQAVRVGQAESLDGDCCLWH